ncbi:MAG: hypothetical protein K0U64_02755 [Actinomycetia bacterium]|nr:hypothetical protein [Actinomycetes bacterium]
MRALNNLIASGSTYLLAGTLVDTENVDLRDNTFRRIKLQAEPFNLPAPSTLVPDPHLVDGGPDPANLDRSLGLWRLDPLVPLTPDQMRAVKPHGSEAAAELLNRGRRHQMSHGNPEQAAELILAATEADPGIELSADDRRLLQSVGLTDGGNRRHQ